LHLPACTARPASNLPTGRAGIVPRTGARVDFGGLMRRRQLRATLADKNKNTPRIWRRVQKASVFVSCTSNAASPRRALALRIRVDKGALSSITRVQEKIHQLFCLDRVKCRLFISILGLFCQCFALY